MAMDDIREIDTLTDGPETALWRSIVEKLAREGEHVNTAVEMADLVVRVNLDPVAEALLADVQRPR
jgi:hypothetical protein